MASYASGEDLFKRYDTQLLLRLLSDAGPAPLSRNDALTHENLTFALEAASGQVESALLHGARYSAADLAGLTGNAGEYLKDIVCCLAMVRIMNRRPETHAEFRKEMIQQQREYLELLQSGKDVFNLTAHVDAGVIAKVETSETVVLTRNLRADQLRGHLFSPE